MSSFFNCLAGCEATRNVLAIYTDCNVAQGANNNDSIVLLTPG